MLKITKIVWKITKIVTGLGNGVVLSSYDSYTVDSSVQCIQVKTDDFVGVSLCRLISIHLFIPHPKKRAFNPRKKYGFVIEWSDAKQEILSIIITPSEFSLYLSLVSNFIDCSAFIAANRNLQTGRPHN